MTLLGACQPGPAATVATTPPGALERPTASDAARSPIADSAPLTEAVCDAAEADQDPPYDERLGCAVVQSVVVGDARADLLELTQRVPKIGDITKAFVVLQTTDDDEPVAWWIADRFDWAASASEYRLGTMTLEGDRVQLQLREVITDESVQETTRTIVCVFSTAECDGMQPR